MKVVKIRFNKKYIDTDKKEHYCTCFGILNDDKKCVYIKPIYNDDYKLLEYLCTGFIDYVKKVEK